MGGFYIHNVPQRSTRVQLKLRTFWNSFLFPFYQRCFHPRPCAVHNMPISVCSTLRFWAIRGNRSNYKCRKCLPRLRINMGAICWLDSSERWKALWILAGGPQGQVYAAEEVNTSENLKQNSCTASLQGLEKTTRERIGEYKPSPLMFFKGWGLALEQQRGRSWLSNSHS